MSITRPMTKEDFDHIVTVIDQWAGGMSRELGHPVFFHQLGRHNRVIQKRDSVEVIAFLFGFLTPDALPVGYVHLVGVHPEHRRGGVGRQLYAGFEEVARAGGARGLAAITMVGNEQSVAFHHAMGWTSKVVPDYAGPGRARVVLEKTFS